MRGRRQNCFFDHREHSARRCASQLPEKRVFFFECTNSGCCPKNKFIFLAASPIDLASSIACLFDCARQSLAEKMQRFRNHGQLLLADFPIVRILTCVGEGRIAFSTTGSTPRGVALHERQSLCHPFQRKSRSIPGPHANGRLRSVDCAHQNLESEIRRRATMDQTWNHVVSVTTPTSAVCSNKF